MATSQPTILVKKSDGTSVRMSWDEFQKYRDVRTYEKNTKLRTTKSEETVETKLPAKIGEEALATTAPVKEIFVDEAIAKSDDRLKDYKIERLVTKDQKIRRSEDYEIEIPKDQKIRRSVIEKVKEDWTEDDNKSLLDESVEDVAKVKTISVLPSKRDDLYDLFVKEIRFPIKDGMRGRLESLIVSFVKGIRTEEQVKGYLKRSEADGGLGFSDAQTGAVIGAIKKVWHLTNTPPAPLREGSVTIPLLGEGDVQTHHRSLHENGGRKFPPRRRAGEVLSVNAKTMMQDVTPPKVEKVEIKKMSVGPVDEIATMSLTNFRQLAPTASQAAQILQEKFFTLKKESIVLYLQAVEVWRSSPLYKDYQDLIKHAVSERRKLPEVVNENKGMKWEEFLEIAEVGRTI